MSKKLFKIPEYIKDFYCKYKYLLLVFIIGIFLMLIGGNFPESKTKTVQYQAETIKQFNVKDIEKMMESLFKKIDGVGDVEVKITVKNGYENVYAYNIDQSISYSSSSTNSTNNKQLILITEDGKEKPIILKINHPEYWGAVIVCEGGDNSKIKYELTQATKSLTGISTDNIIVVKMK